MQRLADALPCPLVVDEAYVDFADTNCLALVAENERMLVTRTLSKSYALAGLRFGYVVAQPQVIEQLAKVKDSYNCDALSIAGATAAIDDRAWFDRTRAAVLATRGGSPPDCESSGSRASIRRPTSCGRGTQRPISRNSTADLRPTGMLVRYMNYAGWGDGLRISVGTDEQVDVLLSKLAGML